MIVQAVVTEVDRIDVDGNVDGARHRFLVHRDRAGRRIKLAAPDRDAARMVDLETRIGVTRINVIGHGLGVGRDAQGAERKAQYCRS